MLAAGAIVLVEFGLLWAGQRMLYSPIRARVGKFFSYVLIFPGTVLHELAHFLFCKILGVPTGRVVLFRPEEDPDGSITFGFVEHAESDPLRGALVAVAPALFVPAAIWGLLSLVWGGNIFVGPAELLAGMSVLDLLWRIPVSLYILMAARGAFPSPGDHIGIAGALALLALCTAIYFLVPADTLQEVIKTLALLLALPAATSALLLVLLRS
jgi:hypothetical protein